MTKKNVIWIARDESSYLWWYPKKPKYRKEDGAYHGIDNRYGQLDHHLFPSILPGQCRKFVEVVDE